MKRLLLLGLLGFATNVFAATTGTLAVTVEGVAPGKAIPEAQAVCLPTADGKSNAEGLNQRPTIRWTGAPKGTASFAIFVMDPDVPADFADAGKVGKTIAKTAKRQDFYHYGVAGIAADATELTGGKSDEKPAAGTELPNDMGLNKYVATPTAFGGPCPPWNDERVHHYHFIVLALDADAPVHILVEPIGDSKPADAPNTAKNTFNRLITSKHVLAKGTVIGTYTLNKQLRAKP